MAKKTKKEITEKEKKYELLEISYCIEEVEEAEEFIEIGKKKIPDFEVKIYDPAEYIRLRSWEDDEGNDYELCAERDVDGYFSDFKKWKNGEEVDLDEDHSELWEKWQEAIEEAIDDIMDDLINQMIEYLKKYKVPFAKKRVRLCSSQQFFDANHNRCYQNDKGEVEVQDIYIYTPVVGYWLMIDNVM